MQTIPVIFARTWKPFSLIIRLFTWSRWSHCGIIDGDNVIEATAAHGVVVTPLREFKIRYPQYRIAKIPVRNKRLAYQYARAEIGKHYDWLAIFSLVLRRDWETPDRWFCSELVAHCCRTYRRESISRITPECLWRNSSD